MNTQKDDTSDAVTPDYDWRAALLRKLDELVCVDQMVNRTNIDIEMRVLVIAQLSIEDRAARALHHLGGLASPW